MQVLALKVIIFRIQISLFCVFILKVMSGKVCSSSNSIIQAQKLVDQLKIEASMERFKVCTILLHCCSKTMEMYKACVSVIKLCFIRADFLDSSRPGAVLSGAQAQRPADHWHLCLVQPFQRQEELRAALTL